MKKILFLVQLPPPIHGASIMNRHVIDVFSTSSHSIRTIELRFVDDVGEIGYFSFKKIFIMISIALKIIKCLVRFKPDIVYFTLSPTGFAFLRDVLYVSILKLFNVEIVYHLHGKGIRNQLSVLWKKLLYKFIFKNTNVIHLSKILEDDIIGLGYSDIQFIANGIELIKHQPKLNSDNKIPQLLFLSNLNSTKGIIDLIESCKILQDRNVKFNLNIVGKEKDISFKALNKRIQDLLLEDKVKVLGAKFDENKYKILNSSDALIFPTFYANECFPLVILEAMQFGLPVISTFEGAIPEIIDDEVTGFLVPQRDIVVLADKMELLITNRDLIRKMGDAGRTKFLDQYSLKKFENNLIDYFDKVLSK